MISLILYPLIFATGSFSNKLLLKSLSPWLLSGIRMFFSGVFLVCVHGYEYRAVGFSRVRKHLILFAAIIILTTFIPASFKAYGLSHMPLSKASLLGSIDPFITALYAKFFFQERLSFQKVAGIFSGFFGVAILCLWQSPEEFLSGGFWLFSYPEVALLIAVFSSRYGWLLAQKTVRSDLYSPGALSGIFMTGAGLLSLLCAVIFEGINYSALLATKETVGLLLYTTIVGNLIGYTLLTSLLKHHSATLMSLIGLAIPACSTLLGHFFLGEPLNQAILFGGFFIILGIVLFSFARKESSLL